MNSFETVLGVCKRHADRLRWAMNSLRPKFPLSIDGMRSLSDTELAILDQFSTRFAKLQDAMGANLFSAVLELAKEPGELVAFLDKLNRLEKIGAIPSADHWLLLREIRNQFSHDYPDDPSSARLKIHKNQLTICWLRNASGGVWLQGA